MAKIPALLLYIYATFYLDQLMHNIIKRSNIQKFIFLVVVFIFNNGEKYRAQKRLCNIRCARDWYLS
jgi:hypothetical protein